MISSHEKAIQHEKEFQYAQNIRVFLAALKQDSEFDIQRSLAYLCAIWDCELVVSLNEYERRQINTVGTIQNLARYIIDMKDK